MRKEQTFRYEEKSKVEKPKVDWHDVSEVFMWYIVIFIFGYITMLLLFDSAFVDLRLWWTDEGGFFYMIKILSILLLLFVGAYMTSMATNRFFKKKKED